MELAERGSRNKPMPIDPLRSPTCLMPKSTGFLEGHNWRGKSFFYWPLKFFQSIPDGADGYARMLAPFEKCHRSGAKRNISSVCAIKVLSSLICPANITRAIISIYINSIKAIPLRAVSHNRVKSLKRCKDWVNLNAASTIILKSGIAWLGAPRLHVTPCYVLPATRFSVNIKHGVIIPGMLCP